MLPHQGRALLSSSSSQIQVAVSATLTEPVALCPLPSAFWEPLLGDLSLIPMGSSSKLQSSNNSITFSLLPQPEGQ